MEGVESYEGFYAIHDHMPGSDRALRVGGTVVFRTGSWAAELRTRESSGNTGINPFILRLDLVITPPPEGAGVTQEITPVDLPEYRLEDPAIDYHEVHFAVVGTDDEPPERLIIQHPE